MIYGIILGETASRAGPCRAFRLFLPLSIGSLESRLESKSEMGGAAPGPNFGPNMGWTHKQRPLWQSSQTTMV